MKTVLFYLAESDQKFPIAIGAPDWGVHQSEYLGGGEFGFAKGLDIANDFIVHRWVFDHAVAAVNIPLSCLKLGFDQGDEPPPRDEEVPDARKNETEGDK